MDQSHFKAQYSRMSDDDLIEVALLPELMPQARLALDDELKLRGIENIEDYRVEAEQQEQAANNLRQQRNAESNTVRKGFFRFACVAASLVFSYGVYLRIFSTVRTDRNDGELLIMFGIALIPLAYVATWISHLWRTKVLYR